jgi:hypothetical protein
MLLDGEPGLTDLAGIVGYPTIVGVDSRLITIGRGHIGHDWVSDCQFLTVWRQASVSVEFSIPADIVTGDGWTVDSGDGWVVDTGGDGWTVDAGRGDQGVSVQIPSWSDGAIVFHSRYFRRKFKGMRPYHVTAQRYVCLPTIP